jgi:small GTP-binding protein
MWEKSKLKAVQKDRKKGGKRHISIRDFPQPYSEISSIGLTRFSNYILAREKICSSVNLTKTIIVGNTGTGKSTLLQYNATKAFNPDIKAGQEGFVKEETFRYSIVGNSLTNKVWDITGDPKNSPFIKGYFESMSAVIITFDLTDFDWETSIQPWIDICFEMNDSNFLIFVVGTKMDLLSEVPKDVFNKLMEQSYDLGTELWITSGKNGYNIEKLFERVAAMSYEVKLATEIEGRAEQERQFQATLNEEKQVTHTKQGFFHRIIKTVNELKHFQANKIGKVLTQGYMGILHSMINMKKKAFLNLKKRSKK